MKSASSSSLPRPVASDGSNNGDLGEDNAVITDAEHLSVFLLESLC